MSRRPWKPLSELTWVRFFGLHAEQASAHRKPKRSLKPPSQLLSKRQIASREDHVCAPGCLEFWCFFRELLLIVFQQPGKADFTWISGLC